MQTMRRRWLVVGLVLAAVATGAACSDDDDDGGGSGEDRAGATTTNPEATEGTTSGPTAPEREIPEGPAAALSPLEGGDGPFLATAQGPDDLDGSGYEQVELMASGTATSYTTEGDPPADGRLEVVEDAEAAYATRIVVRRPTDPEAFDGTVVVEWLNVSGGVDAAPELTYTADEIMRGSAWVGVSAQQIGVEGGTVAVEAPGAADAGAGRGLKGIDPERYGDLVHPGDAFSYDIFTQVGRAVRAGGDDGPLPGLDVAQVLAVGESQSAFTLTTYANGVQPVAGVYDGFLVHSRGGAAAPLQTPGGAIDIAGSLAGPPTPVRDDLDVPTIIVQTEGDVLGLLGYLPARQDDGETVRLWEVAGAAHADIDQIGEEREPQLGCPTPINRSQQGFVLRAALRHLSTWAAGGDAPPEADRLEVSGEGQEARYVLDDVGNVRGGVRTPVVDAPVDVLSGLAPAGASVICALLGSTQPIDAARLAELYPTVEDYERAYETAADAAIAAGFVLEDDREALMAGARPDRIPA